MNSFAFAKHAKQHLARIPTTATIAFAALVVAALPFASSALQYERDSIMAGELWRFATCHVTHWNGEHLLWDLLMFVVLAAWCERRNPLRMRMCLAFGVIAVSSTVFLFFPHMQAYRGLSGVDTALFTLLAVELFHEGRRERDRLQCIATGGLLLGFVAKLAYEAIAGSTIFVDEQAAGFAPLVWDHLAGAVVGMVVALWPPASFRTIATLLHVTKNPYPSV